MSISGKWMAKLMLVRSFVSAVFTQFEKAKCCNKKMGIWLASANKHWNKLSKFCQHFVINFAVGTGIAIALVFMHNTSWIIEIENWAMDSMMMLNKSSPRMIDIDNKKPLNFAYIDIDEETFRSWNEPFHIPRDKLTKLIQFASAGGARAVVVDVDLSKASGNDEKLLRFLKEYKKDGPPLFLLKTFYPPSEMTGGASNLIRSSFIDEIALGPQIQWSQPFFRRDVYDGVVRYWDLLEIGCVDSKPTVLPSIQLILDAQLRSPNGAQSVLEQLSSIKPSNCVNLGKYDVHLSGILRYGDRKINLTRNRLGERIIFTMPWRKAINADLVTIPARRISDADQEPEYDLIENRIVVIGASFSGSRDIYQTPLGEMPGAMIITNAIKSLYNYGQVKPPAPEIKFLIELFLILLMSFAFARFNSTKAMNVSGVIIILSLFPISFYGFRYGLWVDFAVPLIGVQFHQLIAEYKERIAMKEPSKMTHNA